MAKQKRPICGYMDDDISYNLYDTKNGYLLEASDGSKLNLTKEEGQEIIKDLSKGVHVALNAWIINLMNQGK